MRIAFLCFIYRDCKYDIYVFPHTSTQYVKCGSTIEEYKLLSILVLRIDLTVFKIPIHPDTLLKISSI